MRRGVIPARYCSKTVGCKAPKPRLYVSRPCDSQSQDTALRRGTGGRKALKPRLGSIIQCEGQGTRDKGQGTRVWEFKRGWCSHISVFQILLHPPHMHSQHGLLGCPLEYPTPVPMIRHLKLVLARSRRASWSLSSGYELRKIPSVWLSEFCEQTGQTLPGFPRIPKP